MLKFPTDRLNGAITLLRARNRVAAAMARVEITEAAITSTYAREVLIILFDPSTEMVKSAFFFFKANADFLNPQVSHFRALLVSRSDKTVCIWC